VPASDSGDDLVRDNIRPTYGRNLPNALVYLKHDFEACIAHLRLSLGPAGRSGLPICWNGCLARSGGAWRTCPAQVQVIPHAFSEHAVLKLLYGRLSGPPPNAGAALRITQFEQRQLKAIREEIDKDFEVDPDCETAGAAS
jgi:putative transposase